MHYLDQDRDDGVEGGVDHLEAVLIVLAENAGSHECEYRHQVMQNTALSGKISS